MQFRENLIFQPIKTAYYQEEVFKQLQQTGRVNPYTIFELQQLLDEDTLGFCRIDRLCFSIAGNLRDDRPLGELQSSNIK